MYTLSKLSILLFLLLATQACTLNISVHKKNSQAEPISISDISPTESFFLGGEKIKIKGTGFTSGLTVQIAESECLDITLLSSEELECTIPKFDIQSHGLTTTSANGLSSASKKLNISVKAASGITTALGESFQYKSDAFTKMEFFSGSLSHAGRKNDVGTNAKFYRPTSVLVHDGYMYVSDTGNQLIRRVHLSTWQTEDFAGRYLTVGSTDGVGTNATFSDPMGMTVTGGNLYVVENGSCIVRKIDLSSKQVSVFAGQPGVCDFGTDHAIGTSATFSNLTGITTDGNYLYVGDDTNNIKKISLTGTNTVSLAHTNANSFDTVLDLVYLNNALYITNYINVSSFLLLKIDLLTGTESVVMTTSTRIAGITTDGTLLYVSLPADRRIAKIDPSSPAIVNIIGSATAGNLDGIGTAARLSSPVGLFYYNNDVYFTSFGSHNIRKFNVNTLDVRTLVGNNK